MKKTTLPLLLMVTFFVGSFSGCTLLHVHKMEIEQGNVIEDNQVAALRHGMTPAQVKSIMGDPILSHLFTQDRFEYVYTLKPGVGKMTKKRVTCIFQSGRLVGVQTG